MTRKLFAVAKLEIQQRACLAANTDVHAQVVAAQMHAYRKRWRSPDHFERFLV